MLPWPPLGKCPSPSLPFPPPPSCSSAPGTVLPGSQAQRAQAEGCWVCRSTSQGDPACLPIVEKQLSSFSHALSCQQPSQRGFFRSLHPGGILLASCENSGGSVEAAEAFFLNPETSHIRVEGTQVLA